jgi:nitrogen fixation-related uncharacterized protein
MVALGVVAIVVGFVALVSLLIWTFDGDPAEDPRRWRSER